MLTIHTGQTALQFDETTLRCSFLHENTHWRWEDSYAPVLHTKNGDILFSEAGVIRHKPYRTGIGTGIFSHYEQFSSAGAENLAFDTYIWIEFCTGDVHFEWIPLHEPEHFITNVVWPGSMEFYKNDSCWYTLLNIEQGLLLPNGWPEELSKIPFDGRMCTSGSYMPWFAQIKERSGYITICEQPEDAGYYAKHPAGAEYTSVGTVLYASLGTMRYRRTILLHFEENGDYNTICKFYRQYVKEHKTFRTLREKASCVPVDKLVGCFFVHTGIKTEVQPNSRFYDALDPQKNNHLTSFHTRAEEIRHYAKDLGIEKLYLHLDGWGEPGYDNKHPDYLPACTAAGGWDGMKELCDTLHEHGYSFGVHDQYRDYYFAADTYDENCAVRLADGSLPTHADWAGGPQSYLCATLAPYYVKRNFSALIKHQITLDCAYLDVFTCNEPDECSHPWHTMTRKECLAYRSRCFSYLLSQNILTSSEEVTDWSLPNLVFCHYAPYDFMMRQPGAPKRGIPVPLFNLVYHDCVIIPWMMECHETEDYMLYALLNGGAPYFKRCGAYQNTDGAFSSGYAFSEKEQKKRCDIVASFHKKTAYCEMVSHTFLDGDIHRQRTVFSDGSAMEINLRTRKYFYTSAG